MRKALLVLVLLSANSGSLISAQDSAAQSLPQPEGVVATYLKERHLLTGDRPVVLLCGVALPDSSTVAQLVSTEAITSMRGSCNLDLREPGPDVPRQLMILEVRKTEQSYTVFANLFLGPCSWFAEQADLGALGRTILSLNLAQRPVTECILISPPKE